MPHSWLGRPSDHAADLRHQLVKLMNTHLDGKRKMQKALDHAADQVTEIERLVKDVEAEAGSHYFSIADDGRLVDTSPPPPFDTPDRELKEWVQNRKAFRWWRPGNHRPSESDRPTDMRGAIPPMSDFEMIPADMKAASNAATEAADHAKEHGSSEAVKTAVEALVGSTTATFLHDLGVSWDKDIEAWASDVDDFGTAVAEASRDFQSTDGNTVVQFGGLGARVGRN